MQKNRLNKADIAALASEEGRLDTVGTEIALMRIFKAMSAALAEGKEVYIEGFGGFEPFERKARNSRNPSTGEKLVTPAKIVAKFKPAKKLRDALLET
ncbi:MAG: hypothetical protein GQ535_12380 [Rhodobacteraceae bacterium]|nr:hypothetical protein [Paracoccaceae bacterium]